MARGWDRWPSYTTSKPLKAKDGIASKSRKGAIGATWWSRRFVDILESFGMGARLTRGRSYARSGQVSSLVVSPGRVQAGVQGSRARPYLVELRLEPFTDAQWETAVGCMAGRALHAARLLAGEMPEEIEEDFAEAGLSLFPARTTDLATACSCPDWANPCKHVAATLYILAERFDEDPWAIFAWRGRERDALLGRMRELRSGGETGAEVAHEVFQPVPLPDPREEEGFAAWYGGAPDALAAAQRAVAEATEGLEGEGAPGRGSVPDLLGPSGLQVGGKDLAEWLRTAWASD